MRKCRMNRPPLPAPLMQWVRIMSAEQELHLTRKAFSAWLCVRCMERLWKCHINVSHAVDMVKHPMTVITAWIRVVSLCDVFLTIILWPKRWLSLWMWMLFCIHAFTSKVLWLLSSFSSWTPLPDVWVMPVSAIFLRLFPDRHLHHRENSS